MKGSSGYLSIFIIIVLAGLATFRAVPAWGEDRPGATERVVADLGPDGVQRADIAGGEYYYEPKVIVVKVNVPVELRIRKTGGFIPHNIIVNAPEAGIDFKLELKSDFQTVSFTPTRTGKYPMYCDHRFLWFKDHREKGMEGLIEVVD